MPATVLDAGKALANKKAKFLLAWNFIVVGETESTQENKLKILIWLMRAAINNRKTGCWKDRDVWWRGLSIGKIREDGVWAVI